MRAEAPAPAHGEPALADEERFRFLNGFNDVFLTIGVLLVAAPVLRHLSALRHQLARRSRARRCDLLGLE